MDIREIHFGDYVAKINLTRGGNCISLRNERFGTVILREPDYNKLDSKYLYGMPILFPVNRLEGGSFTFEGRKYQLPINESATGCYLHGTLHELPFELDEYDSARLVCSYTADAEHPYLTFGHDFRISMEYILDVGGFTQNVTVTNLSDKNMPCMLGFHTTFNSDFASDGSIRTLVEIEEEYERNMKVYLPTGNKPAFDSVTEALNNGTFDPYGTPISRHYKARSGGRMELVNKTRRLRMVYENDEKYMYRLIYNGKADGYICLEPQTCLVNAPNMPYSYEESGFDYIEPGMSKTYVSKIRIEEI